MTNKQAWIVLGISGVLLVLVGFFYGSSPKSKGFGAIGTNAIENYVPAILYNEGYYSNLPITTTAALISGSFSSAGAISFTGATVVSTFTQGGGVTATSTTSSTGTLTVADFDTENWIDVTLNLVDSTISLPASTTFPLGTTAGQCRQIGIRNASTTAAMDVTIAGGTGTLLKGVSTSTASTFAFKTILGDTDGSNFAMLNACRKTNSDILVNVIPFND